MYIQLDGQILHYEKRGDGAPLIMLHGNGEDMSIFDEAVSKLENNYTVYTIDTRGHGESATPAEFHYRDMAMDLIHFVDALQIMAPVVFGFSDGAIAALMAAIRYPNRFYKLILAGANLSPKGLKGSALKKIKKDFKAGGDPKVGMMLREPNIFDWELDKIKIPVLVLAGERDIIKKSETKAIAKHLISSELKILPKEDHSSYVIHSDKLAPILIDFMTDEFWKY